MSNIVYPNGNEEVTVAAGDSIAVYTSGGSSAQVYRVLGYPNHPDADSLLGTVQNEQTVFGSYSSGATIRIEAGADPVFYVTGTGPVVDEVLASQAQGAPSAKTVAVTLTAAELLTKIVTGTHTTGGTAAYTLPTGTLLDAASEFAIGDSFDWYLINLSAAAADTITLTAGAGHTIVGVAVVQSVHATTGALYGSTAHWRTRKTAANTFVTYRLG